MPDGTRDYQPKLEPRHHLLKSVQDADPVWLRDPVRVEAILCCQFLALLVGALIERQIRTAMRHADERSIPIYPELREFQAPTADGSSTSSPTSPATSYAVGDGQLVQTFEAELTPQQRQILDLLGVPASAYIPN